jgi:hypothetical protein
MSEQRPVRRRSSTDVEYAQSGRKPGGLFGDPAVAVAQIERKDIA